MAAGTLANAFSHSPIIRHAQPMKCKMPNQINTPPNPIWFMTISAIKVTTVIMMPKPNTLAPFFKLFLEKWQQTPDKKIKVPQLICCQYQAIFVPRKLFTA